MEYEYAEWNRETYVGPPTEFDLIFEQALREVDANPPKYSYILSPMDEYVVVGLGFDQSKYYYDTTIKGEDGDFYFILEASESGGLIVLHCEILGKKTIDLSEVDASSEAALLIEKLESL